jgi:cyclopropane fatty-acyl-phospholipid synthase-like methyltransferase
MMKWILMDHSDEEAIHLLRNCRAAMAEAGRMLAVELVMPSDNRPTFNRVMDLQMLLLFGGGRIRTEAEFRTLFAQAGLRVNQILPTSSPNTIIEAMPA